jgi:uncharacterized protein (TIGR02996 family)
MDAGEALLKAIREGPEDDLPRLAYADWLDEHGQPERAELIRVQIERATLEGEVGGLERSLDWESRDQGEFFRGLRAALQGGRQRSTKGHARREARLLKAHGASWLGGLSFPVEFRRGFPEVLEVSARQYLEAAAILERVAPVQAVRLTHYATYEEEPEDIGWEEEDQASLELVGRLADCPQLQRWVELEFVGCPGIDIFESLLSSPHLTRLHRLVATGNEVGSGVALVVDPRFASLRWLDLYNSDSAGGRPGDDVFIDMVTSPHLARLEHFDFGANSARDDALEALASSPTMSRLRTLGLAGNYVTASGLRLLGHSTNLPGLRHLDVSWSMARQPLDDTALAILLQSPLSAQLTFLDFRGNAISDEGVRWLAATPGAAGLRALVLGGTRYVYQEDGNHWRQVLFGPSVRALAESPNLGGLRRLALPNVPLDDELAGLLAGSRRLKGLRELAVEAGPGLTEKGRAALQARFGAGVKITTQNP